MPISYFVELFREETIDLSVPQPPSSTLPLNALTHGGPDEPKTTEVSSWVHAHCLCQAKVNDCHLNQGNRWVSSIAIATH
jgi:hypothetical protein